MENLLLIGINAKFVHSNLAIRSICEYAQQQIGPENTIGLHEYSINQDPDYILGQIMESQPDIIGFSCYLWNIEMIRRITRSIKLLLPLCKVIYGGPEISYTASEELRDNPYVDYILTGEGEASLTQLYRHLALMEEKPSSGIAYREGEHIIQTANTSGLNMDDLPFAYSSGFDQLHNRIVYYETSRGCPFNCQYCLSSIEKGVRFKSLEKVYAELDIFLNRNVRQVKFVDRTFNAKHTHAIGIMEYIIAHDNGKTNFHFEVAPELVNNEFIATLQKARDGLFQLEMGVQSTNPLTLQSIQRNNQLDKITYATQAIKALKNTHIHMDLIAGLPEEGFERFGESFDFVYQLKPDQLQLGFLKVLKGSGMMELAEKYPIIYRNFPPYEVLMTPSMSYQHLESLKMIEEMVELFYNSGQFTRTISTLIQWFETPFKGFSYIAQHWKSQGMHHKKHQKLDLFEFLYECIQSKVKLEHRQDATLLIRRLTYDYCCNEKPKRSLEWMGLDYIEPQAQLFLLEKIYENNEWLSESQTYTTKQLSRMYHMDRWDEINPFDEAWAFKKVIQTTHAQLSGNYIIINYERRNFIDHSGEVIFIQILQES
jgi:radical SAM superfamily enzyme YgiQ (UPF0313 family)